MPGLGGDRLEHAAARVDAGVDRLLVDVALDVVDEVVDRVVVVLDLRLDRVVDLAAGQAAPGPRGQAALLGGGDRLVDHPVDVGADVGSRAG